jgi:uncharacterized protein YkwD
MGHAVIRLEAAHVATEAVASAWQSRALVCAEVCRIGERMKPAPTSTQAEREQIYSAEYDEQGRYDTRRWIEGMPEMIRLRGDALLVICVGLLFVALSSAGSVAAYAMPHDGQGQTARLHAPVGVRLAEPIEDSKREPPDAARQEEPVVKAFSAAQPLIAQWPTPRATKPAPQPSGSWIHGDEPPADTSTLVNVRTCDGGTFALNVAEKKVFELHNETRTAHGLDPLCLSPVLTKAARSRSQDMLNRDYFSHYTPGGMTVIDQLARQGYYGYDPGDYHSVGENIGLGGDFTDQDTPERRFTAWMHSPGHKENILRWEFEEVGVGVRSGTYLEYDDTSTIYTTVFGER